jgi:hypothetical protein
MRKPAPAAVTFSTGRNPKVDSVLGSNGLQLELEGYPGIDPDLVRAQLALLTPEAQRGRAEAFRRMPTIVATQSAEYLVLRYVTGRFLRALGPPLRNLARSRAIAAGLRRVSAIRTALNVGKDRTVAIARVNVGNVSEEVIGVSGKAFRGESVGSARIAGNTLRTGPGRLDAEVKILDDLAAKLDPRASGTIDLFVDRAACFNCGTAVLEFRQAFPNIALRVLAP